MEENIQQCPDCPIIKKSAPLSHNIFYPSAINKSFTFQHYFSRSIQELKLLSIQLKEADAKYFICSKLINITHYTIKTPQVY